MHTCEHHTGHYPSQSNIYCVLLFENSRKRAPSPSERNANFVAKAQLQGWGVGTAGGGWPPHKHFRRKELQEVPRGQSHSFPILAPFRTAHCSPASHCKQHNAWSSGMRRPSSQQVPLPINTSSASWESWVDPPIITRGLRIVRPETQRVLCL